MNESISVIKEKYNQCSINEIADFINRYKSDPRKGVKDLIKNAENKIIKHNNELVRLDKMLCYEKKYYLKGFSLIAGIDEVGRGPLAGPVVAAAVILPEGTLIEGINDSKKLTAKKRQQLFDVISEKAVSIGIGLETNYVIDEINILNATYSAMKKAISNLNVKADFILVDGSAVPGLETEQEAIIKGDEKSISIAAASIIAKVTRDKMMEDYHIKYPDYNFKSNKGYGSASHIEAIKKNGLCPIHRKSFTKNFI